MMGKLGGWQWGLYHTSNHAGIPATTLFNLKTSRLQNLCLFLQIVIVVESVD